MMVMPAHTPPSGAAADRALIHYTYTPYQGLSSTGGLSASIGTALPKLKSMLHGTLEDNTDFYVTQTGAACTGAAKPSAATTRASAPGDPWKTPIDRRSMPIVSGHFSCPVTEKARLADSLPRDRSLRRRTSIARVAGK